VVHRALDLGINFFDTARPYYGGNNERVISRALGARRKGVILSSRSYATSAKDLKADLDTSLKELATDYIDIWYIGYVKGATALTDDMLAVQAAAQKQGKIRFRGISTHRWDLVRPQLIDRAHADVVMAPYSFALGRPDDPLMTPNTAALVESTLDALQTAGPGVVAIKVMAGGYRQQRSDTMRKLLGRPSAYLAALKWALRERRIHVALPSMPDMDKVEENVRAMSEPFGDADREVLAAQLDWIRPLWCRMCGQCSGRCPRGLPTQELVRFVSYADGYGQFPMGRTGFRQLPRNLQAVRCVDCAECVVRCPNGVNIRRQAARAQELFA
jgi:uncharacterized protein